MKTIKLPVYNQDPEKGVSNEYPTSNDAFRQPCLWYISAVRNSGKSYLCSKFLAQTKKDKTFNKIYMITPSFASNRAYFGKYVDENDVYEPTKESINTVIQQVEKDRDEWEDYQAKLQIHKEFLNNLKQNPHLDDDTLLYYYDFIEKPTYKYDSPVKSLLILDDVINSPAISQSSGLGKLATLNRHVAPLKEDYNGRSACGLAVIILSQSYRCQQGIGRLLRENLSLFTLFKNKQEKQIMAIEEEIGSVIDIDKFRNAYKEATDEKYGNLTIDFNPKCSQKTFRKNLNECIIFSELENKLI
tara:strand:+ start:285 stop:1187 length:903 start_codon:yes stop_codon:yes gene_type:complete